MNNILKGAFFFLISFSVFLLFSGCTFPRIIVLTDPLSPAEHINLGVAYEKNGKIDLALKEYKRAAKELPIAYLYLGNVYYQKQDLDKAEKYFKKALKKDPENADAHNNLAWLYYTKGSNLEEAERLVLKALELNSSKVDIYSDTLNKIRELKKSTR